MSMSRKIWKHADQCNLYNYVSDVTDWFHPPGKSNKTSKLIPPPFHVGISYIAYIGSTWAKIMSSIEEDLNIWMSPKHELNQLSVYCIFLI
jgi:hypothetical protein